MTIETVAKPRVSPHGRSRREWAPTLALLAFLIVLPLEWVTVAGASTSDGEGLIKPFHLAAAVFGALVVLRWRPRDLLAPVWKRHLAVYGSYAVILGAAVAAAFAYDGQPYLSPILAIRQLTYGIASLLIAGFAVIVVGRPAQRWLAAAGVLASIALMAGFVIALASQGENPVTIISRALAQADPDIITYELLRTTFRTDEALPEVAANLRHKVFIGLLIAVFAGLAFSRIVDRRHRLTRAVIAGGSAVGFALVLLSLSRSTILCLAIPFMLYPLRPMLRNRARPAVAVVLVVTLAAAVAIILSPIGALLFARFGDSGSYSARLTAAGSSFLPDFLPSALVGAAKADVEISPHNFILNGWLAGGVLAGAAATLLLMWLAACWAREAWRYVSDSPTWVVPVGQLWVLGLGGIPLVRAFTAGNQFHMVEFTAIALFLGVTLANERAYARSRALSAPAPTPDRLVGAYSQQAP